MLFPRTMRWVRSMVVASGLVGLFFLTLGLLSTWAVYADASGATRLLGTVQQVQAPVNSTDSVHLLVAPAGRRGVLRVATSSEVASDFSPGERLAILVKRGVDPVVDDGSGRYTGSLVSVVLGLIALAFSVGLWRARGKLVRKPVAA